MGSRLTSVDLSLLARDVRTTVRELMHAEGVSHHTERGGPWKISENRFPSQDSVFPNMFKSAPPPGIPSGLQAKKYLLAGIEL